jgi:hypothetical protein
VRGEGKRRCSRIQIKNSGMGDAGGIRPAGLASDGRGLG